MRILTNPHQGYYAMLLDLLQSWFNGLLILLGIIFLSYTIPRLITYAICSSIYETRLKNLESTIKKWRQLNEIK